VLLRVFRRPLLLQDAVLKLLTLLTFATVTDQSGGKHDGWILDLGVDWVRRKPFVRA
jgi:hypothetical protein